MVDEPGLPLAERAVPATSDGGLVLVVDADKAARAQVVKVLTRGGYAVREATSGEEALEAARDEQPGVVVLEVALPDVSGYSVCQQLRERFGEDLPIVFVSATRTESLDRVGGLLIGADDYLPKPFASDELLVRVQKLFRRSRTASEAPAVLATLSPREREVLRLLAQGLGRKEIAVALFLSPKTVGTHVERIYKKLGVRTRAEAIALAGENGAT